VAKLAALPSLNWLDLNSPELLGPGLAHLPHLESLRLYATGITDDGLANLANFDRLKWLVLRQTAISDAGLERLTGFDKLASLNVLDCPAITAAGVADLHAKLPACKIESDHGTVEPDATTPPGEEAVPDRESAIERNDSP
jgi:hypothetical protein